MIIYDLPRDAKERVIFCFAYGDAFDGNHEKALAYARFAVIYSCGMEDGGKSVGLDFSSDSIK